MALIKVHPGRQLQIPAEAYNAFVDAAEDFKARLASLKTKSKQNFSQSGIVLILNESGSDCDVGGILGIDGPINTRQQDSDAFTLQFSLRGIEPEVIHAERFAVLLEPIANGQTGRACVSGLCVAKVAMMDESHGYAMPEAGDLAKLKSTPSGTARLVYVEPAEEREEEGIAWCYVLVGSGDVRARHGRIVTAGPNEEADFANHRYWVKFTRNATADVTDPMTFDAESSGEIVMVTNIAEEIGETHYLWDGAEVLVLPGVTPAGERCWFIDRPP